ncbi:MAG: hypothetical protein HQL07_18870 [Nitrospirae bacterium]|nr:hypothetical protein [Magnetococcales bacterium]HAT49216.1 hypothetical protein [Alphaproteobacteria bacterium]
MAELWDILWSSFLVLFLIVVLIQIGRISRLILLTIWSESLISSTLIAMLSGLVSMGTNLIVAIFSIGLFKLPFQPGSFPDDPRRYQLTTADRTVLRFLVFVLLLAPVLILYDPIVQEKRMMKASRHPAMEHSATVIESLPIQNLPKEVVPVAAKVTPEPTTAPAMAQEPAPALPLSTENSKGPITPPELAVETTLESTPQSEPAPPTPLDPKQTNSVSEQADPQAQHITFQTPDGIKEGIVELHKYGSYLVKVNGGGKKWILEKDVVKR